MNREQTWAHLCQRNPKLAVTGMRYDCETSRRFFDYVWQEAQRDLREAIKSTPDMPDFMRDLLNGGRFRNR